jgi:hypothetical protein
MRSGASRVAALLLTALAASTFAHAQCLPHQSSVPEQFVVGGGYVKLPVGAFLLVRKGGEIGAIRIVKIDPVGAAWLGKSTYESYSGSLKAANAAQRTGEIDLHASPAKDRAQVGKWSFLFTSPNVMTMPAITKRQGNGNHGYEFAPTSACTLGEVDFRDKRLQWFRPGADSPVTLPVADLAK